MNRVRCDFVIDDFESEQKEIGNGKEDQDMGVSGDETQTSYSDDVRFGAWKMGN